MGFQDLVDDFGAFYEVTYPVAYRVAFGIVGEHALAEDATQDAYATAFRKRTTYRADGPAEAWLYRIVVNAAISVLRHRHVRNIQPLDPFGQDGPPAPDVTDATVDHLALMDGLQRLDPIARSAVILRYYLDLDYETVGSIIGKSPTNVGSILSRSLDRLQPAVAPDRRTGPLATTRPRGANRHG